MLLTSVILILQETLEAALLLSILAAITLQTGQGLRHWLPAGLMAGAALAAVYAMNLRHVSEWFEYVGQEVINAALQFGIATFITCLAWVLGRSGAGGGEVRLSSSLHYSFALFCALAVTLAICREGSEVVVFLSGFAGQAEPLQAVLIGGGIGFGIGVSCGFLLFYGLMALEGRRMNPVLLGALLALFSGNMVAQASLQLVQADWLQAGLPLWDSSSILSEQSVTGRLMYALAGYESSPTAVQVMAYLAGILSVIVAFFAARRNPA